MTYQEAKSYLESIGQEQLLAFYDELDENEQISLLQQIEATDFSYLKEFSHKDDAHVRGRITPIEAMTLKDEAAHAERCNEIGTEEIRQGHLAVVLLAGGMGTRLGSKSPKGMYDIGETHPVYIFQRLIENLLKNVQKTQTWIHLFIMTSAKNDAPTRAFLKEHDYFGYKEEYVHFFEQEMAPVVDGNGKVLLEEKGKIATSPNGNGGWFISMLKAGYDQLITQNDIRWLNVFAVDNVLQNIADPEFLGAVMTRKCASGSKVVRKADRNEKVGVMCLEDGKPSVIEYIEMTDDMLDEKDSAGEPAYNFGVILNYLFFVPDLLRIVYDKMPVHFAFKKVSYIKPDGTKEVPEEPNAWKFEYFILDMVHELGTCLPYEVKREKEFAPIKNLHGTDSVDSARELCRKNHISL